MINFYVKSISVNGEGKTTSTVDFIDGINIIKGDSDTGKTKVISSILFAMGASHKPFADKTGYDEVRLVIGTPGGDISFSRKFTANQIEVVSHSSEIESDTYTTQYNTNRTPINNVWLKLMGIDEQPMLASNKSGVMKRMTWNNLMRMFYIDEQEICRETSIIEPIQYTEKTLMLSAILYLIYGKSFASDKKQKEREIRKAKRIVMTEYLNDRLSITDGFLDKLKDYSDEQYDDKLKAALDETAISLKDIEDQLATAYENSQQLVDKIMMVEQKLGEMNILTNRYNSLQTQYQSELHRLSFIAEGEGLLTGREGAKKCPYCDNEIPPVKLPAYKEVSGAEERRIRLQITGLEQTQKGVAEDKAELEKQLAELREQYDAIEKLIKEDLSPKKTEFEKILARFQEQIDNRSQYKVYYQLKKEILEDLKNYIVEEPEDEPKDYIPKDYFDADFCERMSRYAMEIFGETNYPGLVDAHFDLKLFDVVINNGTKADDHGKGYCAFINSVVALMLRKYLVEMGTYTPGITIIDSPLHGMFQGVGDDAPESMKTGLFKYFGTIASEGQLIIAENVEHVPELDYQGMKVNVIEFMKHDPGKRKGFLLDL